MELFLFLLALCAFSVLPAAAPVLMRCALVACLRFSPRAALALSSLAALSGCAAELACRGCLRAVPVSQRIPAAAAGLLGGTLGRMLLMMFTARFSGSLALARIQAFPLLLLALAASLPRRRRLPRAQTGLFACSLLCALIEGFFGCGCAALFLLFGHAGVRRRRVSPPGAALLLSLIAELSALLLTQLCGKAEIFPIRMTLALALGSAIGGAVFEKNKKRSPVKSGLRIALHAYMLLAALAGMEQAFLI